MFQLREAYDPPILTRSRVRTGAFYNGLRLADQLEANWQVDHPSTWSPIAIARRTLHESKGGRHPAALQVLRDHYSKNTANRVYVELLHEPGSGWSKDGKLYCIPGLDALCGDFIDAEYHKGPIGTVGAHQTLVHVGAELTSEWSDDDLRRLAEIARKYRIADAAFILKVMASEAGLHPWAVNPRGWTKKDGKPAAVGLLQWTDIAVGILGITEEERRDVPNWTVGEQLDLVDRFYAGLPWTKADREYDSAAAVYMANAAPMLMLSKGVAMDAVLYDSEKDPAAYAGNKGLDFGNKGYLTVGDLATRLDVVETMPNYQEAVDRLRAVAGYQGESSSTPWWKYALAGLFVAGVGAYVFVK